MKQILILALLFSFFTSCFQMQKGIVTFSETSPETFTKLSLRKFLQSNPNPKIVLRVPQSAKDATTEESFSQSNVYNAIEKELLKSGFNVRDRGLFNEILKKPTTTDYSKIRELTDTDLILELVNLRTDIEYNTNKYVTSKKGKKRKLTSGNITLYGASAEFKIILINSNEVAGSFEFNYAPCTQGCGYYINEKGNVFKRSNGKISEIPSYEHVETDFLVEFMSESTRELIENLF
jgi:hypothetical protein